MKWYGASLLKAIFICLVSHFLVCTSGEKLGSALKNVAFQPSLNLQGECFHLKQVGALLKYLSREPKIQLRLKS